MQIYSKRKFRLGEGVTRDNPDGYSFVTERGAFQTIPDFLKNDPMLLAAVQEGSITIVESRAEEKHAEEHAEENVVSNSSVEAETEAQFCERLKVMDRSDAMKLAAQYGLALDEDEKLSKIRSAVLAAYKEQHA